jgi:hypothetical protein
MIGMAVSYFFELLGLPGDGGSIEIRGICPSWADPPARSRRFLSTVPDVLVYIRELQAAPEPYGIYFGVAPRYGNDGTKAGCRHVSAVWVDIDLKDVGGSKLGTYKSLWRDDGSVPKPTMLVDSGHGYHAYWVLDLPTGDLVRIEGINRYLARCLGGDKTIDVSRVLRVPGTLNTKVPDHYRECKVSAYSGFRYDIGYFDRYDIRNDGLATLGAGDRGCPQLDLRFISRCHNPSELGLDDRWCRLITEGVSGDAEGRYINSRGTPDRSALDFAVAMKLVKAGLKNEEIAAMFTNPHLGISDKTLGLKTRQHRTAYLTVTISKARYMVENE